MLPSLLSVARLKTSVTGPLEGFDKRLHGLSEGLRQILSFKGKSRMKEKKPNKAASKDRFRGILNSLDSLPQTSKAVLKVACSNREPPKEGFCVCTF